MNQLQLSLVPIDSEEVKPNDYWVTKANTLIEANYRLSLIQQRVILIMASMVQPDDEDFKWYRIGANDFMKITGAHSHNLYQEMVSAIHNLMEKVITISINEQVILKTHWINDALYRVGAGYVDVAFSPNLKPFFLHLKERFTTYKLGNIIQLKSTYSIRIYELLKQYQNIGKRVITIESLRKMLGIDPKEYKTYNNLKRKVILVAHKEINDKTDISFEFREIKLGRKVNEIEFIIQKKETENKSEELKRQREARKQEKENKKKALQQKKIDGYLAQLSPEEQAALTAEAEAMAREEGGAFLKDRGISEPILNAYRWKIIEKRLAQ